MVEIPRNLQEISRNGYSCCGNTMGMEVVVTENPQRVGKRATIRFLDRPLLISACVLYKSPQQRHGSH